MRVVWRDLMVVLVDRQPPVDYALVSIDYLINVILG